MNETLSIERRRVPRRPASQRGSIFYGDVERGCFMKDFSDRGARLELGAATPLPLRFELQLPGGKRVKAFRVWQREAIAGISFDRPLGLLSKWAIRTPLERNPASPDES